MLKKLACALLCAVMLCGCSSKTDSSGGTSSGSPDISASVTYNDEVTYQDDTASPTEEGRGGSAETPPQTTASTALSVTSPAPQENDPESLSVPEEIYEPTEESDVPEVWYTFRRQDLYDDHYKKHGAEFGSITQEEYLEMANALIASEGSPDVLTKYSDDGDYMYFNTVTEEFLVLSEDGYIRTYFIPTAGIKYWNRQ